MVEYKYKLLFWPIRGRGEPILMLFAFAGVEYENFIMELEDWPEWKPNLAGNTPVEAARLDMLAEQIQDMINAAICGFGRTVLGWLEGDKNVYFKEKVQPVIDEFAPFVEKFLADNGGNGLFMGDKVIWVDIFGAGMFALFIDFGHPNAMDKFPLIRKMIERVHNIPSIKQYCDNRPPTKF